MFFYKCSEIRERALETSMAAKIRFYFRMNYFCSSTGRYLFSCKIDMRVRDRVPFAVRRVKWIKIFRHATQDTRRQMRNVGGRCVAR